MDNHNMGGNHIERPVIKVISCFAEDDMLKEILCGIEEEGIPYEVIYECNSYNIEKIATKAMEASILGIGIALKKDEVCVQCRDLYKHKPLFYIESEIVNKENLRIIGTNSARYVKSMGFIYEEF